eukprot:SAG31_NODE_15810_length_738_cov_0.563380_1_plen_246_part_11
MPKESDLVAWLRAADLTKYCPIFLREEIDLQSLRLLTDRDLQNMGISALGPRRKLVELIAKDRTGMHGPPVDRTTSAETANIGASSGSAIEADCHESGQVQLTPPLVESELAARFCRHESLGTATGTGTDAETEAVEPVITCDISTKHFADTGNCASLWSIATAEIVTSSQSNQSVKPVSVTLPAAVATTCTGDSNTENTPLQRTLPSITLIYSIDQLTRQQERRDISQTKMLQAKLDGINDKLYK